MTSTAPIKISDILRNNHNKEITISDTNIDVVKYAILRKDLNITEQAIKDKLINFFVELLKKSDSNIVNNPNYVKKLEDGLGRMYYLTEEDFDNLYNNDLLKSIYLENDDTHIIEKITYQYLSTNNNPHYPDDVKINNNNPASIKPGIILKSNPSITMTAAAPAAAAKPPPPAAGAAAAAGSGTKTAAAAAAAGSGTKTAAPPPPATGAAAAAAAAGAAPAGAGLLPAAGITAAPPPPPTTGAAAAAAAPAGAGLLPAAAAAPDPAGRGRGRGRGRGGPSAAAGRGGPSTAAAADPAGRGRGKTFASRGRGGKSTAPGGLVQRGLITAPESAAFIKTMQLPKPT